MAELIDLLHLGRPHVIASYLLRGDEPALVDCGPTTCLAALEAGLAAHGLAVEDLRHLLLTHIHLDHAGAAGVLARRNPRLRVHVSELGAPHLVDPAKLERSARRLYGEEFDVLWGELAPVPEEQVAVVGERVLSLEAFPTPGHASHHVTFVDEEGSCYAGDATGVRVLGDRYLVPVAPPPDITLEAWQATLDAIRDRRPARLLLPHFGAVDDPLGHVELMRDRLATWAGRVGEGASEEEFAAAADEELREVRDPGRREAYRQAAPAWQSYLGLRRYWDKKREQEAA